MSDPPGLSSSSGNIDITEYTLMYGGKLSESVYITFLSKSICMACP